VIAIALYVAASRAAKQRGDDLRAEAYSSLPAE
jgi:uncharacterized protein HemY